MPAFLSHLKPNTVLIAIPAVKNIRYFVKLTLIGFGRNPVGFLLN